MAKPIVYFAAVGDGMGPDRVFPTDGDVDPIVAQLHEHFGRGNLHPLSNAKSVPVSPQEQSRACRVLASTSATTFSAEFSTRDLSRILAFHLAST
ncbi:MAG: hypothetical protein M9928_17810 [Anaerolineae bacterium]|nr:hypothetical protein [Anaerolineae bacterium]